MLKILAVAPAQPDAPTLVTDLESNGLQVCARCTCVGMVREAVRHAPDMVIVWDPHPGEELFEATRLLESATPAPVLVFTSDVRAETMETAIASGIDGWVVNGYAAGRLRPLIQFTSARHRQMRQMREELGDLKRRLEEQSHLSPMHLADDRDLAATIENAAGNWVEYLGDQGRDGEADDLNEALVEMGRRRTARRDPEDLLNHVRSVILSEVEGLGGWEDDGVEVAPAGSGADHAAILYRVMTKLDLMPESQIPKAQSFTGGELGPEEQLWVSDFMERALASEHDDGLYDEAERLGRLYPDLWDRAGES